MHSFAKEGRPVDHFFATPYLLIDTKLGEVLAHKE